MTAPIDLALRRATMTDIDAVVALVESAYRGESGLRGWTTESLLLDGQRTDAMDVAQVIARPDSCILLAESGDVLLASCHVERQGEESYFGMFAVDPTRQNAGVGKRMLAEAERIAREEFGCSAMVMSVLVQRTELIDWYIRRGYKCTGHFKPFPYGDERFGIPRRDDLRFEVLHKALAVAAA